MRDPFDLERGLLLEKRGIRLLWGTPFNDLQRIGSPILAERKDSLHLEWNDERCFGGIVCSVSACRIFGPVNPRAYLIYLDTLHFLTVNIRVTLGSVEQGFGRVLQHLRRKLGDETFFYPPYRTEKLPGGIFWEGESWMIGFSRRGDISPSISIQHTPSNPEYENIKAEAKAIQEREGEGLRTNGRWTSGYAF
jgi:hypothetical protein